jgi:cysteinyl-tRNA synthetase
MTLRLYDTLTRQKRDFQPANPGRITMYVCGPTVYNRAHIGNFRPAVVFDVLARLLRHTYGDKSLVYARNITDIEDKIMAAADREGVPIDTITSRYAALYEQDSAALGVGPPDVEPFATGHVADIVAMIERLIATGHAYVAEQHVLFDVGSDPSYGILSHRDRESMIAGARVDVAPYKRGPTDFVLWKPSSEDQPGWDSPWGRGRPGWHIECSAMIARHLDQTIDIHGGGLDLEFPHHENEIAQSRCAHGGAALARYWVHNGMLSMASGKMSKSVGNIVTVDELLAQGHRGEVLRLALLTGQYRQPLEWTDQLIGQSKATLDGLYRTVGNAEAGEIDAQVLEALSDDLNTPAALARLAAIDDPATLKASATLLGLLPQTADQWFRGGADDAAIEARIAERSEAKSNRDFATADRIRDELKAEGILLEDGPSGTNWRKE